MDEGCRSWIVHSVLAGQISLVYRVEIEPFHAIECNTMRGNTMQENAIQRIAIPYRVMPCNTLRCDAMPCNPMQYL